MGRVVRVMAVMPGVLPVIVGKDCGIQRINSKLGLETVWIYVSGFFIKRERMTSTFSSFSDS